MNPSQWPHFYLILLDLGRTGCALIQRGSGGTVGVRVWEHLERCGLRCTGADGQQALYNAVDPPRTPGPGLQGWQREKQLLYPGVRLFSGMFPEAAKTVPLAAKFCKAIPHDQRGPSSSFPFILLTVS